ncbi:MAG: hypothetical protein B6D46_16385 [Polyangiaceae bacterium UTPRO1]|jgi:hypothetical protein|nr:DUF4124 domain-containing protein [Myxococcales bacterium]OQY64680.1 MAG: hypothetical protein B6D46_16385 [Polyangiaceae bacterium UTPRO1]
MTRLALAALLAAAVATPAHGEIYRWVDAHGVMHLDDTLANVPEGARAAARVFQSRVPPPIESTSETAQAAFANGIARELGLVASDTQSAVSALGLVGIYPSAGWHPAAALTAPVVEEVTRAARAAARGHRLAQSEASAEAAVLRVASGLGVAGPPPSAAPEPAEPQTIVVAPNIVVEPPPAPAVVIRTVERAPVLTRWSWDPGFGNGMPFAPIPSGPPGPIPDRITPLSNPAGRLHGPAVPPRPGPQPFRRPPAF